MEKLQPCAGSLLLADLLREWWMTVGHSKSAEPAQMARAIQILSCIQQFAELLGLWVTNDSSLTPFQKKVGQALEALALELSEKLAEARGAEKADRASTPTRSKRNSSGKLRLHREAKP